MGQRAANFRVVASENGRVRQFTGFQGSETFGVVLEQARARAEGMAFVAPYDDPYTIAGQGTIGREILTQCSMGALEDLHAIFVAIGGGGLIAGIAAYVKLLKPEILIIGVEPTGGHPIHQQLGVVFGGPFRVHTEVQGSLRFHLGQDNIEPQDFVRMTDIFASLNSLLLLRQPLQPDAQ